MRREKLRGFIIVGTLLVIISLLFIGISTGPVLAQSATKYPKVVRFATLSPGTVLYATISGLCKVATDNSPMTLIVVPTAGPPTWLPMMNKGSIDVGMENFSSQWQMWTGKAAPDPIPKGFPAKPPYPKTRNIRLIMSGPLIRVGMLTRKDSGLKEIRELRGKKISWGWSAFPQNIGLTLGNLFSAGLTIDDVKTVPMTEVVAGVKAVQEGRVDASSCAVGMGAIAEADALVGVRFLRGVMGPEADKAGQRAMQGCYTTIQKAGPPGVPEDTPIWSAPLGIQVPSKMPDHVVYKLVETWWTHHKEYAPIHPLLRFWTPETFINKYITLPYHNGAIQFYKDKGVWTPEMEKIHNKVLNAP